MIQWTEEVTRTPCHRVLFVHSPVLYRSTGRRTTTPDVPSRRPNDDRRVPDSAPRKGEATRARIHHYQCALSPQSPLIAGLGLNVAVMEPFPTSNDAMFLAGVFLTPAKEHTQLVGTAVSSAHTGATGPFCGLPVPFGTALRKRPNGHVAQGVVFCFSCSSPLSSHHICWHQVGGQVPTKPVELQVSSTNTTSVLETGSYPAGTFETELIPVIVTSD